MRTVTFGCANSLDNFIARPNGAVDWLKWTPDVANLAAELWKTIDTVVMGRKTYEAALTAGTSSYPGVKNYVVSRSMQQPADPAVEVIAGDGVEFVRRLKQEHGAGICVLGGGVLGKALLEAGLIDEFGVNVHPVILGRGVPLFYEMDRQLDLELREHRVFANGCVYLLYRVLPDTVAAR